ncbi:glycosyltransferase family 2 protein [Lactobacillus helveticus]|uniref:glycosyltransferase family 2 protein n=1 Tax=Lactobacillus helveticus TaxID=1587 RepID=UPI0015628A01|nr:glycosyltransferase [Lactobacillus helveticus]
MELSKVSIIIPVYKAENSIEKCIKSILDQTYKKIELLLVDDGSPDKVEKFVISIKRILILS